MNNYIDLLVGIVLALIMFGVGLTLTFGEFKRLFNHPKVILIALFSQMAMLPLIAFIICNIVNIAPEWKVGLMILSSTPGGATSGFITYLFKGNVALSLSLTTMNSLLTLVTIPIIANLSILYFLGQYTQIHLPFLETMQHIFIITIVPAIMGLIIKYYYSESALKLENPIRIIMLLLLLIVFSIKLFADQNSGGTGLTKTDIRIILPVTIVFNLCCLLLGYFLLRLFSYTHRDRLTTAIESGVHNTTLAFLVAGSLLQNQEMVKPALIYSLFSFWSALIFCALSNKLHKSISRKTKWDLNFINNDRQLQ